MMPHDDPKIPGSPANTMRRLKQIRRKVAQLITDAASCNDNSPHFRDCPLDTGADRMFLREIDMAIEKLTATGDTHGLMDGIIAQGDRMVRSGLTGNE